MDLTKLITVLLLAVGALLYLGGIARQGWLALHNGGSLPPFLHHAVTTIGAVLATYFGAVFGVKAAEARVAGRSSGVALLQLFTTEGEPPTGFTWLQVAAVLLYFVGLLAALVIWLRLGFAETAPDLIKSMSVSLLGVIAGMLAIALNVKQ